MRSTSSSLSVFPTHAPSSTTAASTTALAHALLPPPSPLAPALELALRALFFGLNLASNAVMWALFTRALAAGSSATRVAVLNTSANFLATAALGWLCFGERSAGLWWAGAAALVGGAAIVGRSRGGEEEAGKGRGAIVLEGTEMDEGDEGEEREGDGDIRLPAERGGERDRLLDFDDGEDEHERDRQSGSALSGQRHDS